MENNYYLKIARASDLKDKKERRLFRFFEILPGFMAYTTLFLAVFLSWKIPVLVAFFIIIYDLYWFFRSIYFAFHLKAGYQKMRRYEKIDWIERLNRIRSYKNSLKIKSWDQIYHLVIMPIYKEPYELVKESFNALKNCDYPKNKMIVVLACEERAREEVIKTAQRIENEFKNDFFRFLITWHPDNIEGEVAGHGSNDAWASREVKEKLIDTLNIPYKNIIVSSFDVDTCVFKKYFSCLTYKFLKTKKPLRTSFQPIPLYINNVWQCPPISRVFSFSSTFWHTMNQERPEKLITFSSHSMSYKTLVDVGYKQVNVVSDDSRIFWQCFLKFNGDYRVEPLSYPVSMDANCTPSFKQTMINVYKQQRRWAWGASEIPYFLFAFLKNKKIPLKKKIVFGWEIVEGHLSWATSSILIFLLGWLPLFLGGEQFAQTLVSYNLPYITSYILTITMFGLVASVYFSLLLLPPRPINYGKNKYFILAFEWFLIPFIMIFFTALPALDAQTRLMFGKYMGFWVTPKCRT